MKEAIEGWLSSKGYGFSGEAFIDMDLRSRTVISEMIEECLEDITKEIQAKAIMDMASSVEMGWDGKGRPNGMIRVDDAINYANKLKEG